MTSFTVPPRQRCMAWSRYEVTTESLCVSTACMPTATASCPSYLRSAAQHAQRLAGWLVSAARHGTPGPRRQGSGQLAGRAPQAAAVPIPTGPCCAAGQHGFGPRQAGGPLLLRISQPRDCARRGAR